MNGRRIVADANIAFHALSRGRNDLVASARWPLASPVRRWDAADMQAYEEVAEFIARRGPREVADFRPSPESREHVVDLLEREKAGGLSAEERRELDHYEDLELLMNLTRAHARQLL